MAHDLDLVQTFLQESLQRRHLFLFSPVLKAHHHCGVNQLIGLQQGIVATVAITQDPLTVLVNPGSCYRDLIHQILAGEHFLRLTDVPATAAFWPYKQVHPPKAYQFNCTASKVLWMAWWRHRHQRQQKGLLSDLLIWVRQQWYPVRTLVIQEGKIHIKSLIQEIVLSSQESVVWLERIKPQRE